MGSRLATAAAGIALSLLVSVALRWLFDTLAFFLFVPFVPFLFRGSTDRDSASSVSECPDCGFRTADESFEYCPRDGTRLE